MFLFFGYCGMTSNKDKFDEIVIKKDNMDDVVKVHNLVPEFGETCEKSYFENRCKDKKNLIIVAYIETEPVGYLVGYDRYNDWSFYCWMAWVIPKYRQNWVLTKLMEYQNNRAKVNGYNKIKIKTRNNKRQMLSYLAKNWFNFLEIVRSEDINDNRILLEKNI